MASMNGTVFQEFCRFSTEVCICLFLRISCSLEIARVAAREVEGRYLCLILLLCGPMWIFHWLLVVSYECCWLLKKCCLYDFDFGVIIQAFMWKERRVFFESLTASFILIRFCNKNVSKKSVRPSFPCSCEALCFETLETSVFRTSAGG